MLQLLIAAALVATAALAEHPDDIPCVTWEPLTYVEPTPPLDTLFIADYNWLVANKFTMQCIQKGYIIPCFASDQGINTWGHHDYVEGFSSSDYCRTWHDNGVYYSHNMYVPKKGPKYKTWKWKLAQTGGKVPDNAIRFGESVMARSTENPPDRCMGDGFTGWAVGKKDGTFGDVHFSIFKDPFTTDSFQVAICKAYHPTKAPTTEAPGTLAPATPTPTALPMNKPYIRFGHTIPCSERVDAVITQGNVSKTWSNYGFGQFSTWTQLFSPGTGTIDIYESNDGTRGKLLLSTKIPLTPGPLAVVIKDYWPPKVATNVETIACSYVPTFGNSGVRVFNLSPDTQTVGLNSDGNLLVTDIAYSTGSAWAPVPVETATFSVFNANNTDTLTSIQTEPPEPPLSFTIFLIGLHNATKGSPYHTRGIPLIDAPEV